MSARKEANKEIPMIPLLTHNLGCDSVAVFDGCGNPSADSVLTRLCRVNLGPPSARFTTTSGFFFTLHRSAVGILRTALPKTRACYIVGSGRHKTNKR